MLTLGLFWNKKEAELSSSLGAVVLGDQRSRCSLLLDSHPRLYSIVLTGPGSVGYVGAKPRTLIHIVAGFYGSSKAAVQSKALHRRNVPYSDAVRSSAMGETLAIELAPLNIRVLIVEPGAFRTEGIYSNSFDVSNPIADYEEQRADSLMTYKAIDGKQPGDPAKAMDAVVDVVRGEGVAAGRGWPLYLVLGKDAERDIRAKCGRMLQHLEEWSDVVRGTDL